MMEEVVFVRRMEHAGETASLPGPMVSLPRRWEYWPLHTLMLCSFMRTAVALGAPTPGGSPPAYKAHDAEKKVAPWPVPYSLNPLLTPRGGPRVGPYSPCLWGLPDFSSGGPPHSLSGSPAC
jgi:hypothetical protein